MRYPFQNYNRVAGLSCTRQEYKRTKGKSFHIRDRKIHSEIWHYLPNIFRETVCIVAFEIISCKKVYLNCLTCSDIIMREYFLFFCSVYLRSCLRLVCKMLPRQANRINLVMSPDETKTTSPSEEQYRRSPNRKRTRWHEVVALHRG